MAIKLYKTVEVKGQSYKGVKKVTIPSQSMTLKEILKRFVRREQLPIEKQGIYTTRFGDLEKLALEDITVQVDRAKEIRDYISQAKKRMKDQEDKRVLEEMKKLAEQRAEGSPAPDPKTT